MALAKPPPGICQKALEAAIHLHAWYKEHHVLNEICIGKEMKDSQVEVE